MSSHRPAWLRRDARPATRKPRPRCVICGYMGWYGSRWHNPENYSHHYHCVCGRPCSACAIGDGFHRSLPEWGQGK